MSKGKAQKEAQGGRAGSEGPAAEGRVSQGKVESHQGAGLCGLASWLCKMS